MREIPIIDLEGGFAATLDRDMAMVNDYIGEIPLYPRRIANEVGYSLKRRYKPYLVFYYGTPDEHLRKLFGYD